MNTKLVIEKGAKLHFIGIGGIGMSGLAQMYNSFGCQVTGSDRGSDRPENQCILGPLATQGITIFPQDGSFVKNGLPDFLVYSTAIEEDNPDLIVATGVKRIHRADALAAAVGMFSDAKTIAVTGSCGKTTVTAWLAETMFLLGLDPSCLDGGLINRFRNGTNAGNFHSGQGKYFVFEADESDKSLLAYEPDYAIILNIGTDHYEKDELVRVFGEFLGKVKIGAILELEVYNALKNIIPPGLKIKVFSSELTASVSAETEWFVSCYSAKGGRVLAGCNGKHCMELPTPGMHNAFNALSILAMLDMLGVPVTDAIKPLSGFQGVWRRFDYAGKMFCGAAVYDDYAHNPEKIASCIKAAQEVASGRVFAIFQPHGFGPLGFMQQELLQAMERTLRTEDYFILMPSYYAGGTSSFKPTSEEVVADYKLNGSKNYSCIAERSEVDKYLSANVRTGDVVLIMGARDNSLSDWAHSMVAK